MKSITNNTKNGYNKHINIIHFSQGKNYLHQKWIRKIRLSSIRSEKFGEKLSSKNLFGAWTIRGFLIFGDDREPHK